MTVKAEQPSIAPTSEATIPQPNAQENTAKTNTKRRKKAPMVAAVVAAVVILGGGIAFGAHWFINNISPQIAAVRAFENFSDELNERLETTPLQIFSLLGETLQNGVLSVEVEYRESNPWGMGVSLGGEARIYSNAATNDFALLGNLNAMGFINADFGLWMNQNRIAASTSLIDGGQAYGITFGTVRNDIRPFGQMIGMSQWEMDELADIFEMLDEMLNSPFADINNDLLDPYTDQLIELLRLAEMNSTNTNILVNGVSTSVEQVTYVITGQHLVNLLDNWVNTFANDQNMRNYFNLMDETTGQAMWGGMSTFDMMVRDLRWAVEDLQREINPNQELLRLSLYIGNRDRLVRATASITTQWEDWWNGDITTTTTSFVLDLGASATDTWTLTVNTREESSWGVWEYSGSIVWTLEQLGGTYLNNISIIDEGEAVFMLFSEWNPQTGHFELGYTERDWWGVNWAQSFTGNFTTTGAGGFRLAFNQNDFGISDQLTIAISGQPGVPVPNVDFINLNQWDQRLYDSLFNLENLLFDLMWNFGW